MYGKNLYGLNQYAQEKIDEVLPEEYYTDLTRYVPSFIGSLLEMKELYKTQGREVGRLKYCLEDLTRQCFLESTDWGLTRWERIYGITTNMALSHEQRREIIMAKIRGQGTTTKRMIEETASVFSGGEVQVIEKNNNSLFIIRFIGTKGIPRNMNAFVSMLEDIKPAHLSYRFEYRYTVWKELEVYTWDGLSGMTWDDTRILKEV